MGVRGSGREPRKSHVGSGEIVMQLQLSEEDRTLLQDLLERAMGDLREEVYKTDTYEYRDALRHREARLDAILGQVRVRETVGTE